MAQETRFKLSGLSLEARLVITFFLGLVLCVSAVASFMALSGYSQARDKQSVEAAGSSSTESDSIEIIDEEDSNAVHVDLGWFVPENMKIGHAHLNGQTLVYFCMLFLMLLTSYGKGLKISFGALFAVSILLHTVGLFFRHKAGFDLVLALSGSLFLVLLVAMDILLLKELWFCKETVSDS